MSRNGARTAEIGSAPRRYALEGLRHSDYVARALGEAAVMIISFTTVATAAYGMARYRKIKQAISMKVPTPTYNRASIGPYLALMSLAAVAISVIIVI